VRRGVGESGLAGKGWRGSARAVDKKKNGKGNYNLCGGEDEGPS